MGRRVITKKDVETWNKLNSCENCLPSAEKLNTCKASQCKFILQEKEILEVISREKTNEIIRLNKKLDEIIDIIKNGTYSIFSLESRKIVDQYWEKWRNE